MSAPQELRDLADNSRCTRDRELPHRAADRLQQLEALLAHVLIEGDA